MNILRDVPVDLRNGRCYLPAGELFMAGLSPADLLEPKNILKFRKVYDRYLALAEGHLAAGWAYTNALPRGCFRVKLACAWPVLIGAKTLAKLRAGNVLDPEQRIKVSRPEVKKLILKSVLCYPWPGAWRRMVELAKGVNEAIHSEIEGRGGAASCGATCLTGVFLPKLIIAGRLKCSCTGRSFYVKGEFMHIPKLLTVFSLAAFCAVSVQAQRPDSPDQIKAREALRQAMSQAGPLPAMAPSNAAPAAVAKAPAPPPTMTAPTPAPVAAPALMAAPMAMPAQTMPAVTPGKALTPEEEEKAVEAMRKAMEDLDAKQMSAPMAATPPPAKPWWNQRRP